MTRSRNSTPAAAARSGRVMPIPLCCTQTAVRGWLWSPLGCCRIRPVPASRSNWTPQLTISQNLAGASSQKISTSRRRLTPPPRMVSAKCDCGESAGSACPMATEKPADVIADDPARPAVPLVMTATRAPAELAAIAARSAASPPPRISTSVSSCLIPTDTHRSLAGPVSWARASREMNRLPPLRAAPRPATIFGSKIQP